MATGIKCREGVEIFPAFFVHGHPIPQNLQKRVCAQFIRISEKCCINMVNMIY